MGHRHLTDAQRDLLIHALENNEQQIKLQRMTRREFRAVASAALKIEITESHLEAAIRAARFRWPDHGRKINRTHWKQDTECLGRKL